VERRLVDYEIDYDPSYKAWDSFLSDQDPDNLQQSYEFGEASRTLYPKTKIARFLLKKNGKTISILQGFHSYGTFFGGPFFVEGHHGTGPVIAEGENKQEVYTKIVSLIDKYAKENKVPEGFIVFKSGMENTLHKMGYNPFCSHNLYKLYLYANADIVWKAITHNKRKNIRNATKQGIEVINNTSKENLILFYEMLNLSSKRVGFKIRPFQYYSALLKVFEKFGKARIFTAYLKDQPVAGLFVISQGNTVHALSAGSLPDAWKARPNDVIHWKAIEWSCREGFQIYNMGAVPDPPGGSLWRWKSEWQGQLEKMPTCNKIFMTKSTKGLFDLYGKIEKHVPTRNNSDNILDTASNI
jgi:lipid II:glycine glycyltransferase (peptidoglycan interpeptide bridge formation enzyme)